LKETPIPGYDSLFISSSEDINEKAFEAMNSTAFSARIGFTTLKRAKELGLLGIVPSTVLWTGSKLGARTYDNKTISGELTVEKENVKAIEYQIDNSVSGPVKYVVKYEYDSDNVRPLPASFELFKQENDGSEILQVKVKLLELELAPTGSLDTSFFDASRFYDPGNGKHIRHTAFDRKAKQIAYDAHLQDWAPVMTSSEYKEFKTSQSRKSIKYWVMFGVLVVVGLLPVFVYVKNKTASKQT